MTYLFDASSIIALVVRGKVDPLMRGYTLDLAGYEVGNYLWKEAYLFKSISPGDLAVLAGVFTRVFNNMRVVKTSPLLLEVLRLACRLGVTYYDASYLYHAKKLGLTLVTEDKKLMEKAKGFIRAMSSSEVV